MNILEKISPQRPLVMGILNLTPDSFSDGGELFDGNGVKLDRVLVTAEAMLKSGADILDIGGESTRPGAVRPSVQQELDRVLPVAQALKQNFDCCLSVDTSSAEVMRESIEAGAALINDVRALREPGALEAIGDSGTAVCLMHMQGSPDSMQDNPNYSDLISEVTDFLRDRTQICVNAGLSREQICLDPGFGFGKTLEHNMLMMANLDRFALMGLPLLIGVSRKGMIGEITGKQTSQRLAGSLAMAQIALERGANILRVHDVAETLDMLKVWRAIREQIEEK